MAPKKNIPTTPSPSAVPTTAAKPTAGVTSASGQPTRDANKPSSATKSSSNGQVRNAQDLQNIGLGVWNKYVDQTPQRVKLLDAFLLFLMAVGLLQFVYCVIAGNFVSIHTLCGTDCPFLVGVEDETGSELQRLAIYLWLGTTRGNH